MPAARTPVRPKQPKAERITLELLFAALQEFKHETVTRLEKLEKAGLNGYTEDFKAMVDEYRAERKLSAARELLRAQRAREWGWLRRPWSWIKYLAPFLLGALGWRVVSSAKLPPGL